MSAGKKIKVAVVGLGFGAEFIPLYQKHPDAECYAICQRDEAKLNKVGDLFKVERRFTRFEDLLKVKEIDAIHVVTPIAAHAPMSIAALEAGKHAACTVPMATTVKECLAVAAARQQGGQGLHDDGDGGVHAGVPLREGAGRQGGAGKAPVPARVPPAEHEPAGLAGLLVRLPAHALRHARGEPPALRWPAAEVESVVCFGSGTIREEYAKKYGSPLRGRDRPC